MSRYSLHDNSENKKKLEKLLLGYFISKNIDFFRFKCSNEPLKGDSLRYELIFMINIEN